MKTTEGGVSREAYTLAGLKASKSPPQSSAPVPLEPWLVLGAEGVPGHKGGDMVCKRSMSNDPLCTTGLRQ